MIAVLLIKLKAHKCVVSQGSSNNLFMISYFNGFKIFMYNVCMFYIILNAHYSKAIALNSHSLITIRKLGLK